MARGKRGAALAALLLAAALGAGCIAGESSQGFNTSRNDDGERSFDASQVSNNPGSFGWQGGMGNVDDTRSWTWTNPGPRASVSWQGGAASGSFTLTILDAAREEVVFQETIEGGSAGQFSKTTDPGVPGPWTIQADLDDFTGSMQLSIQTG